MPTQLTEIEARIVGSLIEKSLATPEQYPLTLKGLANACNQKTSREPVMNLEEGLIGKSIFPLIQKGVVEQKFELGSRVPKFRHRVQILLGDENPKVVGVVCVLLLRGPQTPGELKGRTDRLCEFLGTAEVEGLLQELCARNDPFVRRLPRQPGQKEARYQHLFCGAPAAAPEAAPEPVPAPVQVSTPQTSPLERPRTTPVDRLTQLEQRIEALEARVRDLEQRPAQV